MHWVSTCALVLFVVLCVAILPAVLFNTILIPSQNTEPAPGSTEDESGPYYPSTCPNNGSPLAAPQGNCNGQSSSNVKIKFGCTQTNLTCQHLTQWSLTKVAQPSVTLGTNEIRTHVPMFSISAQPSSAGFVFKANFQMSLDNDKKCEAKIASILILLQQITTRTSENGYGEACNQKHVWAVAGSENPVTAGKCNSPGLAQICTGSGSSKCNVTIPYISNSIWVGNSLVNLTNLTLPAMLKNPLVLNTTVYFQLSDANATLIQANPNRYVIDVLISYDSCCNKTSTCAIDIDCDGIKEALATAQATLPLNPLLSSICKNSTEQCGQVTIKDVPQPLMTNNSNMNCLISGMLFYKKKLKGGLYY